jgi:hypothetical protein
MLSPGDTVWCPHQWDYDGSLEPPYPTMVHLVNSDGQIKTAYDSYRWVDVGEEGAYRLTKQEAWEVYVKEIILERDRWQDRLENETKV